ncbi:uncharacterized protein K444DRAFT_493345, partial [Hyaloscypha bicolor E]
LDNTIIATAIPKITSAFDSLQDVGWYGKKIILVFILSSYGHSTPAFIWTNLYILALVIFELGSIMCATARNSIVLIIGRAIAGAGASALFSGAITIVGFTTP